MAVGLHKPEVIRRVTQQHTIDQHTAVWVTDELVSTTPDSLFANIATEDPVQKPFGVRTTDIPGVLASVQNADTPAQQPVFLLGGGIVETHRHQAAVIDTVFGAALAFLFMKGVTYQSEVPALSGKGRNKNAIIVFFDRHGFPIGQINHSRRIPSNLCAAFRSYRNSLHFKLEGVARASQGAPHVRRRGVVIAETFRGLPKVATHHVFKFLPLDFEVGVKGVVIVDADR